MQEACTSGTNGVGHREAESAFAENLLTAGRAWMGSAVS